MSDKSPKEMVRERAITVSSIDQAIMEAPTIQVDGAHGIAYSDGLVRFNFYQDRLRAISSDDDEVLHRVVCARIVMTPKVFLQLHTWMTNMAEQLKAMGTQTAQESQNATSEAE